MSLKAAFYTDPFLVTLITETINGNQELKILSEEIRIASNEAFARSGEYRPFVTLGAGARLRQTRSAHSIWSGRGSTGWLQMADFSQNRSATT